MADILNGLSGNYSSQDQDGRSGSTTSLNTGALRRKYNFGDKVSELNLASDPFFRFVSMVSKKPTDDPAFKFTEKRSSYSKRYAYMLKFDANAISVPATDPDAATHTAVADSSVYTFKFFTDYNNNGNNQNIVGQAIKYGDGVTGVQPLFFVPGQIIKLNTGTTNGSPTDYELWKINSVDLSVANYATVNATCVRTPGVAEYMDADTIVGAGATVGTTTALGQEALEPYKCYVVGSAFAQGSGYPETWQDQPYSTGHGQTQIFKTSAVMNNTDRATVLKYQSNEWARIWKEKLIEHKWDIEQAMLFGSQNSTANTTQGAVDFISTYGNSFALALGTKTQDSFLDDMSNLLDPRYNNATSTVFFASTAVYNWLHKLSGYFSNNVGMVEGSQAYSAGASMSPQSASMGRADFALGGKKKVFGIDITTISTIYGDMNVARNIHLDGTNIGLLGINMKYCAYRPLVGNGLNRDTGIYVGVQTLENSGVDRRVDQILTEAGMEWSCPETHSIWIQS
jgi:hypothetical protein